MPVEMLIFLLFLFVSLKKTDGDCGHSAAARMAPKEKTTLTRTFQRPYWVVFVTSAAADVKNGSGNSPAVDFVKARLLCSRSVSKRDNFPLNFLLASF